METAEERLAKTKAFIENLLKKERYYKWTVKDVLVSLQNCVESGTTAEPKEV